MSERPWTIRQREERVAARYLRERLEVFDRETGVKLQTDTADLIDDAAKARVPLLRIIRFAHSRPDLVVRFGHVNDVRKAFREF